MTQIKQKDDIGGSGHPARVDVAEWVVRTSLQKDSSEYF